MTPPTPSAAAPLEVTDESVEKTTPSSTPKGSESRSPGRLAWKRFKRDRTGVISAYIVIFFFVIAICAPLIAKLYGKNPYTTYASQRPELLDDFSYPAGPNGGMSSRVLVRHRAAAGPGRLHLPAVRHPRHRWCIAAGGHRADHRRRRDHRHHRGLSGRQDRLPRRPDHRHRAVVPVHAVLHRLHAGGATGCSSPPTTTSPTSLRAASLILVLSAFGWASIARLLRGQVLGPARAGVHRGGQGHRRVAAAHRLQGAAAQPVDADPHPVHA